MPYQTEDFIHLPNPDHPESEFRLKPGPSRKINIVGTTNFGNGVKGRLGLLKKTGKSAIYVYLFDKEKYDLKSAKEWLENHRSKKNMKKSNFINKKFKFDIPLVKAYTDDSDGYYYLEFSISNTTPDLQKDAMEPECLEDMAEQFLKLNAFLNHDYTKTIGPYTAAWVENDELWVKARVKPSMTKEIKEDIDTGVRYGGSIRGELLEGYQDGDIRRIQKVLLLEGSLTPMPANFKTLGTARGIQKECTLCSQIFKSIERKYNVQKGGDSITAARNESDSYEALSSKIRAAINNKFSLGDRSRFWVRRTWPDAVIAESFDDDKLYEIPYSIDENGEVVLGEPKEADTQYVEKMTKFYESMLKDVQNIKSKNKSRGDNLTDKTASIPEGMDESFVEKLKSVGEDGKQFIKGLLGFDKEDPKEPGTTVDPTGDPLKKEKEKGDDVLTKDTLSKEDVEQLITKSNEPLIEKIGTLETENKSLKDRLDKSDEKTEKTMKKDLLKKAIELNKKLNKDMTPEEEAELVKTIKDDLEKDNGIELVQRDVQVMSKALEFIPEGDRPFMHDPDMKKQADAHAKSASETRERLDKRGR